jgi:hypothetical protein
VKFQIEYRRSGKWVRGNAHPTKAAAVAEAQVKWKSHAFDGYRVEEVDSEK